MMYFRSKLLGNMITGKGISTAGYGNKEGKGVLRAGYGNIKKIRFHPIL